MSGLILSNAILFAANTLLYSFAAALQWRRRDRWMAGGFALLALGCASVSALKIIELGVRS